jgi:hypothetical protein
MPREFSLPQKPTQWNVKTSFVTVVPENVAVVVVDAVCVIRLAVVWSNMEHAQPVVAVADEPIVTTGVHVPVVPEVNFPAVAPPVSDEVEQPEIVKVVPMD